MHAGDGPSDMRAREGLRLGGARASVRPHPDAVAIHAIVASVRRAVETRSGDTHPRRAVSAVGRIAEAEMVMAAIVRAFVGGARGVAAGRARLPSVSRSMFWLWPKNFRVAR